MRFWMVLIFLALAGGAVPADESAAAPEAVAHSTGHQITIDGRRIDYSATVGWLIMTEDDEPVARFGYTAYTRESDAPDQRPILFAFNGGPGSSSIWLHMGILGPQRVVVNDAGYADPPPAKRVDNEFSIIDIADLVMVDPIGTGFSTPLGEATGEKFWGVDEDVESVAAFIRKYINENGRWASPEFVLGESYGGVRGAGLAHYLQSRFSMNLNGLSRALIMNPGLQLHIQQGYYDLATPFAATNYYLRHLDIPTKARERIRYDLYPAGHMMYRHEGSMRAYREDLVEFIRNAIP